MAEAAIGNKFLYGLPVENDIPLISLLLVPKSGSPCTMPQQIYHQLKGEVNELLGLLKVASRPTDQLQGRTIVSPWPFVASDAHKIYRA